MHEYATMVKQIKDIDPLNKYHSINLPNPSMTAVMSKFECNQFFSFKSKWDGMFGGVINPEIIGDKSFDCSSMAKKYTSDHYGRGITFRGEKVTHHSIHPSRVWWFIMPSFNYTVFDANTILANFTSAIKKVHQGDNYIANYLSMNTSSIFIDTLGVFNERTSLTHTLPHITTDNLINHSRYKIIDWGMKKRKWYHKIRPFVDFLFIDCDQIQPEKNNLFPIYDVADRVFQVNAEDLNLSRNLHSTGVYLCTFCKIPVYDKFYAYTGKLSNYGDDSSDAVCKYCAHTDTIVRDIIVYYVVDSGMTRREAFNKYYGKGPTVSKFKYELSLANALMDA
jgi:hypothetical protein